MTVDTRGRNGVLIRAEYREGYGAPSRWYLRVTWNNCELICTNCGSEFDAGRNYEAMVRAWSDLSVDQLNALSLRAPAKLASPWCTDCGGDTIDGRTSIGNRMLCKRCSPAAVEAAEIQRRAARRALLQPWVDAANNAAQAAGKYPYPYGTTGRIELTDGPIYGAHLLLAPEAGQCHGCRSTYAVGTQVQWEPEWPVGPLGRVYHAPRCVPPQLDD